MKLSNPKVSGSLGFEDSLRLILTVQQKEEVKGIKSISLEDVSQLLWACQGVSLKESGWIYPLRTAPSAGALYPLELYLLVEKDNLVNGLEKGMYRYIPAEHSIIKISSTNPFEEICIILESSTLKREDVKNLLKIDGKLAFLITAIYRRITSKYGERGIQYTYLEVGHAIQNLLLQALNYGLRLALVRGFSEDEAREIFKFKRIETPLALVFLLGS